MELLLLLTALFASLTGASSAGEGPRAAQGIAPGIAFVRAAEAAQAVAQPARRALPASLISHTPRAERASLPLVAQAPLKAVISIFERRLE